MIRHALAIITLCTLGLVACASPPPSLNSIPPGEHKTLATQLAARSPRADATAFHRAGGTGYIMTGGGVRMPILPPGMLTLDSRDFESLKPFDPALYSQIYPLLDDPKDELTIPHFMGHKKLSPAHQTYRNVRSTYALNFNKRMYSLANPRPKQPSPLGR